MSPPLEPAAVWEAHSPLMCGDLPNCCCLCVLCKADRCHAATCPDPDPKKEISRDAPAPYAGRHRRA